MIIVRFHTYNLQEIKQTSRVALCMRLQRPGAELSENRARVEGCRCVGVDVEKDNRFQTSAGYLLLAMVMLSTAEFKVSLDITLLPV